MVVVPWNGRQKALFWDEAWFTLNRYWCSTNRHAVNKPVFTNTSGMHMLFEKTISSVTFDYFWHHSLENQQNRKCTVSSYGTIAWPTQWISLMTAPGVYSENG